MTEFMEHKYSDAELRTIFTSSCIESAAKQLGCNASDMFKRMDKIGFIENYIWKFYNSLHTQSRAYVTEDIIEALNTWESRK